MEWFRLYDEIIHDPKVRRMKSPAKFGILITMFCIANKGRPRGTLTIGEGIPYTTHEIARLAMATVKQTQETIDYLLSVGILIHTPGSTPTPIRDILEFYAWDRRQYTSDNVTARVHKHRDKRRNETLQKRFGNVTETPPETETETETESDSKGSCRFAAPPENLFNFPEEYWEMVATVDTLPAEDQLNMMVKQYNKKYPAQFRQFRVRGSTKARETFKETMQAGIAASEILREILFDIPDEGEPEPAPWNITYGLINNRGLDQTRAQVHYEMALQLERGG